MEAIASLFNQVAAILLRVAKVPTNFGLHLIKFLTLPIRLPILPSAKMSSVLKASVRVSTH
jgi:hypothetical protein